MGIRFFCPNGHKLNVKEFQAGRRGICPFCGARIMIPTQSTRPASKSAGHKGAAHATTQTLEQDDQEAAQASDSSPDILPGEPPSLPGDPTGGKMLGPSTPVGTPPGSSSVVAPPTVAGGGTNPAAAGSPATSTPAVVPAGINVRPVPARQPSPGPDSPTSAKAVPAPVVLPTPSPSPRPTVTTPAAPATVAPPAPGPAPSPPAAPEPADPIAEAPEMIWYVRPPSGGQFGPAAGDLMRTWLTEGRVSADSLVWREGWRDWQEAGKVFPKLRGNQIIDFLETTPIVTVAAGPSAHAHRPKAKQPSDRNQIALLIGLSVLVLVLIVVFLVVLFH